MSNEEEMTKSERRMDALRFRHLGILISFVIRHLNFVIYSSFIVP
jgi:hypothetical protein